MESRYELMRATTHGGFFLFCGTNFEWERFRAFLIAWMSDMTQRIRGSYQLKMTPKGPRSCRWGFFICQLCGVWFLKTFAVLCLRVLSCQEKNRSASFDLHVFTGSWRWSDTGYPQVSCSIQGFRVNDILSVEWASARERESTSKHNGCTVFFKRHQSTKDCQAFPIFWLVV